MSDQTEKMKEYQKLQDEHLYALNNSGMVLALLHICYT